MEKIRTWRTLSDSIRWEKYNRKRSTIRQSKKPFGKRMQEEMDMEKKMEQEEKEQEQSQK